MTYVVIDDDPAAKFRVVDERPTLGRVEHQLREMGYGKLRPARDTGMMLWLSDVGLVNRGFRRNTVGACVAGALGARIQPVGGPVVVTGYDFPLPGEEEGGWPEDLDAWRLERIIGVYLAVLDALGMPLPAELAEHHAAAGVAGADWKERIRVLAAQFRGGDGPAGWWACD